MDYKKRGVGSFEDLEVWKQARKIQRIVRQMIKRFPTIERYRLEDQMIRSSRSIARNIADIIIRKTFISAEYPADL